MASPIQQIISSVQLGSSASSALYTCPGGFTVQIMKLTVSNPDASAHTYTLYLVPSGGSASAATTITPSQGILSGATFNDPNIYGQVLNQGDSIWAYADTAAKISMFASGLLSASS